MDSRALEKFGLNANESRIYLALLRLGSAQAGKISKQTQVNRTSTYDALERLIAKGLVAFSIEANRKLFFPAAPSRFLELLKEQEKIASDLLPELNKMFFASKEKEESNIYKGKKGIKSILQDILNYNSYVAFGSGGRFFEIMGHDFSAFQKRKIEKKIRSRIVVNISSKTTQGIKEAYASFRFIPDEYSSGPVTTFVFGEKVAIVIWAETPFATVISSKEVAENFKHHFELLWKMAKK
ncbi:MAG: helix-turn-helix domain-containing protein [Candidatus ainarchaeum sp.]|nr:helix-turn-helix domain-containing protein [Candidatus ainarchaeum sp.]